MAMSPPKPVSSLDDLHLDRLDIDLILEKNVVNIGSPDLATAYKAIDQMYKILQSNKGSSLIDYEDQFMTAITKQLKLLQPQDPGTNTAISRTYRALFTVIDAFYNNKGLGRKVSVAVLKNLINQLLILLIEDKLEDQQDGESYMNIVDKIIESSDHTSNICASVKLLHECVSTEGSSTLTEDVVDYFWEVITIMPYWADEIDYDSVLYEVHIFLKDFPSSWWKNKAMDTPLRTVKTILHSVAKVKGDELMLHLGKIPNTSDSELESYILRLLKTLKLEEVKQVPLKSEKVEPRKTLSRSVHTMLTDIFQKIVNKEESKEGFNMLYDFLRQHPDADRDQVLQKLDHISQEYIRDGLKSVELARNGPGDRKY